MAENFCLPQWKTEGFHDIKRIHSGELIEELIRAIDTYGQEEVVVLCRSNKRANRYNQGIRQNILFKEEEITKGDRLMSLRIATTLWMKFRKWIS